VENCDDADVRDASQKSIREGLDWLFSAGRNGIAEQLFLAYNGEVMYPKKSNNNNGNPSGCVKKNSHTLVPSDYPSGNSTSLWDEELHMMIRLLPSTVRMVIFLDCRLSWNIIRLPHIYLAFKNSRFGKYQVCRTLTSESHINGHGSAKWGHNLQNYPPPLEADFEEFLQNHESTLKTDAGKETFQKQLNYYNTEVRKFEGTAKVICFGTTPTKYRLFTRHRLIGVNWIDQGDVTYTAMHEVVKCILSNKRVPTIREVMVKMAKHLSPRGLIYQVPQVCSTTKLDLDESFVL
ncbi:MAG: hypothetical protein AAGJ35_15280, partial [Myxococcota bacterium]